MTEPLEALAFRIGIKPALRLRLSESDAAREIARWRAEGAVVIDEGALVYVARDEARARAVRDAESTIRPGGEPRPPDAAVLDAHRALGRHLGYPACCVEGFVERVARGVDVRRDGTRASERVVALEEALARSTRRLGRLNFLLPRRQALVPFDPCAFDCPHALSYADTLFTALEEADPEAAARLRRSLARTTRVTLDGATHVDVTFEGF